MIKKNGCSVRPVLLFFNLSHSPHASLLEIINNRLSRLKHSDFLFTGSWGGASQVKMKLSHSKLSRGELLVRPPHRIDVFSMLGPSQAYIFYY